MKKNIFAFFGSLTCLTLSLNAQSYDEMTEADDNSYVSSDNEISYSEEHSNEAAAAITAQAMPEPSINPPSGTTPQASPQEKTNAKKQLQQNQNAETNQNPPPSPETTPQSTPESRARTNQNPKPNKTPSPPPGTTPQSPPKK